MTPTREAAVAAFSQLLLGAVAPLAPSAESLAELLGATRHRRIAKRTQLLRAGDVAEDLFFVHAGLLRYYISDAAADGEERTGQFFDEGSIVTDAASFLSRAPAEQTFEALEDSSVLLTPHAALYRAYDRDHALERFGRLMLETALVGSQRRSGNLLNLTPDQRYRRFIETRPALARRVPQYLVASYLGLTPETLSRIRRRITKGTDR
ncbi:MAG: Crp/Fnr family transcriptional regulator [Anaerolineae bacterium]